MKAYISERGTFLRPSSPNAKLLWAFLMLLFISYHSSFITSANAQTPCPVTPTSSVLAQWSFNGGPASGGKTCNGAVSKIPVTTVKPAYFLFQKNLYVYCPSMNSGCGSALIGSVGHSNTSEFDGALCVAGFWNPEALTAPHLKVCGGIPCHGYDPNSSTWNPGIDMNFYTTYTIPKGKYGFLGGVSVKITTKYPSPSFAKQGIGVYRNGVLIYSTTQNITAVSQVLTFVFPNTEDFKTDGSQAVDFKITWGLVQRLQKRPTAYDDMTINGYCSNSPFPTDKVTSATCGTAGVRLETQIDLITRWAALIRVPAPILMVVLPYPPMVS
jgi:hypothetical protein